MVVGSQDGYYGKAGEGWALRDSFSHKSGGGLLGRRRSMSTGGKAGEHGVCSNNRGLFPWAAAWVQAGKLQETELGRSIWSHTAENLE